LILLSANRKNPITPPDARIPPRCRNHSFLHITSIKKERAVESAALSFKGIGDLWIFVSLDWPFEKEVWLLLMIFTRTGTGWINTLARNAHFSVERKMDRPPGRIGNPAHVLMGITA
jgi:hypothetical protein